MYPLHRILRHSGLRAETSDRGIHYSVFALLSRAKPGQDPGVKVDIRF